METEIKEIRDDVKTLIQTSARFEEKLDNHNQRLSDHVEKFTPMYENFIWKKKTVEKLKLWGLIGTTITSFGGIVTWLLYTLPRG